MRLVCPHACYCTRKCAICSFNIHLGAISSEIRVWHFDNNLFEIVWTPLVVTQQKNKKYCAFMATTTTTTKNSTRVYDFASTYLPPSSIFQHTHIKTYFVGCTFWLVYLLFSSKSSIFVLHLLIGLPLFIGFTYDAIHMNIHLSLSTSFIPPSPIPFHNFRSVFRIAFANICIIIIKSYYPLA